MQLNPITKKLEYHEKGEWMTDEEGNYFTATIGNQQKGDDEIVVIGDILTKEYSAWNKFDFWDSDDQEKSIGGIAMKTFVNLLPYLTPLRGYYGAFTAFMSLLGTMPILYKNIEGIFTGDNRTGMTDAMTSMENWFYKWDSSKTVKGSESFWNIENLGQLVADTFGQLYQQRAAASLAPKVLKMFDTDLAKVAKYRDLVAAGTAEAEAAKMLGLSAGTLLKQGRALNSISSAFSTAYMGLTQSAEIYNETLKAGYDRRTAGIAGLASMAALYKVMRFNSGKNGIGDWFLDKTIGFDSELARGTALKLAKQELKTLKDAVQKAVVANDRNALAYALKEWKRKGASLLHDAFVIGGEDIWKGMLVEGVEEVTEEVTQDFIKGMVDTMSWLGWTAKEGSFGGWSNVFSKQGLERYLSVFVGGAIGGGIFKAQDKWINPLVDNVFSKTPVPQKKEEIHTITKLILDNRFDEYIDALKKGKKFIHNSLDSTSLGDGQTLGTQGESQADVVVKTAIAKAYSIKTMLEGAVGNFADLSDFEKQFVASKMAEVLDGYDFSKSYINGQFEDAASRVADLTQQYTELKSQDNLTEEQKESLKLLKDELDASIETFKGFFSGASFNMSVLQGKLLAREDLVKGLMYTKLEDYAMDVYDVDYSTLDDKDKLKQKISDEFKLIEQGLTKQNLKQTLPVVTDILIKLLGKTSANFKAFSDSDKAKKALKYIVAANPSNPVYDSEFATEVYNEMLYGRGETLTEEGREKMRKASINERIYEMAAISPEKFSILPVHDFDLFSQIESELILTGLEGDQVEILKEMVNEYARRSHVQRWSPKHIFELITTINDKLSNPANPYTRTIFELAVDTTETPSIDIKNNGRGLPSLESVKIQSLLDFISDDNIEAIDQELQDMLANILIQEIVENGQHISDVIKQVLNKEDLVTPMQKLEVLLKKAEENSIVTEVDPLSGDIQEDPLFDETLAAELREQFNILASKPVIENQIVSALKAMYRYINNGSEGQNIFDWIADKNKMRTKRAALESELSLSDKNIIKHAKRAIDVLTTVIEASTETQFVRGMGVVEQGGIVDFVREYSRQMGIDHQMFHTMSKEDAEVAKGYLVDLRQRLDSFITLNESLAANKHAKDKQTRKETTIGFAHAILEREFKIGSQTLGKTDVPDDEKELEQSIENRLQEVREAYLKAAESDSDYTLEKFIGDLWTSIDGPTTKTSVTQCAKVTDLFKWDREKQTLTEDKFYLLKRLLFTAITDRKQIQSDIKEVLTQEGKSIYPKFDQQLAIEELLYRAYDIKGDFGVFDALASFFADPRKPNLHNTSVLFGTAGSGKSFVLEITKGKLESILGKKFIAASKTNKNLTDIKQKLGIEGEVVDKFLNDRKDGLGNVATEVNNTFSLIAKLWAKASTETKPTEELKQEKLADAIISQFIGYVNESEVKDNVSIEADSSKSTFTIKVKTDQGEFELFSVFRQNLTSWSLKKDLRYVITKLPEDLLKDVIFDYNLIVDEITLTSPTHAAILSALVSDKKSLAVFAGDYRQQALLAPINESGNEVTELSPMLGYSYHSAPVFMGSYRFTNNLTTENLNTMVYTIDEFEGSIPVVSEFIYSPQNQKELQEEFRRKPLAWQVLQGESPILIGHKITQDKDKFILDLKNTILRSIKDGETLAVITEDDEAKTVIKEILEASGIDEEKQVTYINAGDVQGGEYDYVVAYGLKGYKTTDYAGDEIDDVGLNFPKAFTVLSRGRFGTLVYDTKDGLFAGTGIHSTVEPSVDGYLYQEESGDISADRVAVIEELIQKIKDIQVSQKKPDPSPDTTVGDMPTDIPANADDQFGNSIEKKLDDASILQTWYIRLGVTRESLSQRVGEWLATNPNPEGPDTDLQAYIKMKNIPESRTMKSVADEFVLFRNQLREELEDKDSKWHTNKEQNWRYVKLEANELIDYPYEKFNDETDWTNPGLIFQLIQLEVEPGYWITIGKLGYNKDANDEVMSETQDSIFRLIEAGWAGAVEFSMSTDEDPQVTAYLKGRSELTGNVGTSALVRYENLRDLVLNANNARNKTVAEIDEDDLKLGRVALQRILKQGYVIEDVWDPLEDGRSFEKFKQWYKSKNIYFPEVLKDGRNGNDVFEGLQKRVWVSLRPRHASKSSKSAHTKVLLINRVYTGNDFLHEDFVVGQKGGFRHWAASQLGRLVIHIVKSNNASDLEAINTGLKGKSISEQVAYVLGEQNWLDSLVSEVLSIDSSLSEQEVRDQITTFINTLPDVFEQATHRKVRATEFTSLQWLQSLISSQKYYKFFYQNTTNNVDANLLASEEESKEWVATRFIEPSNLFINWNRTSIKTKIKPADPKVQELMNKLQCGEKDLETAVSLVGRYIDDTVTDTDVLHQKIQNGLEVTLRELQEMDDAYSRIQESIPKVSIISDLDNVKASINKINSKFATAIATLTELMEKRRQELGEESTSLEDALNGSLSKTNDEPLENRVVALLDLFIADSKLESQLVDANARILHEIFSDILNVGHLERKGFVRSYNWDEEIISRVLHQAPDKDAKFRAILGQIATTIQNNKCLL